LCRKDWIMSGVYRVARHATSLEEFSPLCDSEDLPTARGMERVVGIEPT